MTEGHQEDNARNLRGFEIALGHCFSDPGLLDLAVTHSSTASPSGRSKRSNERLEFLGDRVLGLAIADMLYQTFPDEDEGSLARRYSALVRKEALAEVAERLSLGAYVRMSQGEAQAGGRGIPSLLADACEATIAAIYLDGGMDAAAKFVRHNWQDLMERQIVPPKDAKTELQEWAQGRGLALPEYRENDRQGPSHSPTFSVRVLVQGEPPMTASGPSKRAAEKAAAEAMLARIWQRNDR